MLDSLEPHPTSGSSQGGGAFDPPEPQEQAVLTYRQVAADQLPHTHLAQRAGSAEALAAAPAPLRHLQRDERWLMARACRRSQHAARRAAQRRALQEAGGAGVGRQAWRERVPAGRAVDCRSTRGIHQA